MTETCGNFLSNLHHSHFFSPPRNARISFYTYIDCITHTWHITLISFPIHFQFHITSSIFLRFSDKTRWLEKESTSSSSSSTSFFVIFNSPEHHSPGYQMKIGRWRDIWSPLQSSPVHNNNKCLIKLWTLTGSVRSSSCG